MFDRKHKVDLGIHCRWDKCSMHAGGSSTTSSALHCTDFFRAISHLPGAQGASPTAPDKGYEMDRPILIPCPWERAKYLG